MTNNNSELHLIFSTPIWTTIIDNYENINTKMYNFIYSQKKTDEKGKEISNNKGWHSQNFNLNNENVIFFVNSISSKIKKAMDDMGWDHLNNKIHLSNMWSIINNTGASNTMHMHSNCFLSAAYYVKAPINCGEIVFYDHRQARLVRKPKNKIINNLNAEEIKIEPKDGLLVLFPNYLYHSVNENLSNEERVVISFNIDFK